MSEEGGGEFNIKRYVICGRRPMVLNVINIVLVQFKKKNIIGHQIHIKVKQKIDIRKLNLNSVNKVNPFL